jgi:hypothetical protein
MYPNKIDELIDNLIDDVYATIIAKDVITKATGADNFVKYQEQLDNIFVEYIETLPISEIETITHNKDRINDIIEVLKHYTVLYVMLTFGANYTGKMDKFISNIVEYTKNQKQYRFRVENFFTSDSTSRVVQFTHMIKNINKLLSHSPVLSNLHLIKNNSFNEETSEFLIGLTDDYIDAVFIKQKKDSLHNIIKTLIILNVYREHDKKRLYTMIEQSEQTKGEYKFIDVYVPKTNVIDYAMIESALPEQDVINGMGKEIWDYLNVYDKQERVDINDKINELFNKGLVVPILDDFLLYHRETEKYDKDTKTDFAYAAKDDTKLRYIIGKIDTASELYSQSAKANPKTKAKIMNTFSLPLYNKKAILRNEVEERKIMKNMKNVIGSSNMDNASYLEDLMEYRKYSYVNFKNFDKYGFSHYFTKTVTAVRSVNMETEGPFKQVNNKHKVQNRVASINEMANIVGLMILPNTNIPVQCLTIGDLVNVRDVIKGKNNGYEMFYTILKKTLFSNMKNTKGIYWLFDQTKDQDNNVATGDVRVGMSTVQKQDSTIIKNMLGDMHDRLTKDAYNSIIDYIDDYDKSKMNVQVLDRILNHINDNVIELDDTTKSNIINYYFTNLEQSVPDDVDRSILYGIEGDVVKLPSYAPPEHLTINKIHVDLSTIDTSGKIIEHDKVHGLCQHNITFEKLSKARRLGYNEYLRQFYNFMGKYVTEDTAGNYVCKSCGYFLDIQKHVEDGKYDDNTKQFITFSSVMYVDIAELSEYRSLAKMIGQIDKDINKICSSIGIAYYVGANDKIKARRRNIIKSTIDMLRLNTNSFERTLKKYNMIKHKKFGINNNMSSLFKFKLENDIYFMSSQDKDKRKYKIIKKNNILTYALVYLMLELNTGQISFFLQDNKLLNVKAFDTLAYRSLFKNFNIITNNKLDTEPLMKYPLLCYVIYMLSFRMVKHKLWSDDLIPTGNKQINYKQIASIQRMVIYTIVDVINVILFNSFVYLASKQRAKTDAVKMKKLESMYYIYDVFRTRFYNSLDTVYSDNDFYSTMVMQSKEQFALGKSRNIDTTKNFREWSFRPALWNPCQPQRYFPYKQKINKIELHDISNLTHCDDGHPHVWKTDKDAADFKCEHCGVMMSKIKYDSKKSKSILKAYRTATSNILAKRFCLADGTHHQYEYDTKRDKIICVKCKKTDDHTYDQSDIEKIDKLMLEHRESARDKVRIKNKLYIEDRKEELSYNEKVINRLYGEIEDKGITGYEFVNEFIDVLRDAIGADEIKGEYPVNLLHDTYIINHNRYGTALDTDPIVISEVDAKFTVKKNHPHFKRDVLYYTDSSDVTVDIFYDAVTKKLLGYKEVSKDYVDIKNSNKKIRINYSTLNKIKLLGYNGRYLNVFDYDEELSEAYKDKNVDDRQPMYAQVMQDVSRRRLSALNNIMLSFQKTVNAIMNGYDKRYELRSYAVDDGFKKTEVKNSGISNIPYSTGNTNDYAPDIETYHTDKRDDIIARYTKSLNGMAVVRDGNKVFKHWKGVKRGSKQIDYTKSDMYINLKSDLLDMYMFNEYDNVSRNVLYYLLREFTKIIEYNTKAYLKNSLANFIAEFIDRVFFEYNMEYITTDIELRRFQYILISTNYISSESSTKTDTSSTIVGDSVYSTNDDMNDDDALAMHEEAIDNYEIDNAIDIDEDTMAENISNMLG